MSKWFVFGTPDHRWPPIARMLGYPLLPMKPPNKGRDDLPAEAVEGRRSTKGNTVQTAASRTQCRKGASNGLQRVREAARKDKDARFTTLLHHVTVDALGKSFQALQHQASPGVDGVTWAQYQENLGKRLNPSLPYENK